MAVVTGHSAVLTGAGDPEKIRGFSVGADFFSILGVKALQGRSAFTPEDSAWHGTKSVLVNETLWRTRFGSDPALVGKMLTLDNENYQVAEINFRLNPRGHRTRCSRYPFTYDPADLANSRGAVYLNVVARTQTEARSLRKARPPTWKAPSRRASRSDNIRTPTTSGGRLSCRCRIGSREVSSFRCWSCSAASRSCCSSPARTSRIFFWSAASPARVKLAVRTATGAQGADGSSASSVTEAWCSPTAIGARHGIQLLAIVGTRLLVAAAPTSIPRLDAIHVDGVVLAFTLGIAISDFAWSLGLVPARQMVRPDIAKTLREGGRSGGNRSGGHIARRGLVVAEVALSMMLLAGAGLLIRSFNSLMAVDPGFRTENSISFALSLPDAKYHTARQMSAFMSEVMERMHALPGVQSAGSGFGMPLTNFGFGFSFTVAGRAPLKPSEQPDAEVRVATPDYFTTMGIRIVKGRGFTDLDRSGGAKVLLVTETAAKKFFPGEDPIGKHVTFGWTRDDGTLEGDIVGIVADVKQSSLAATTLPQFWAPYDQWPMSSMNVVLHTARDPQAVVADARSAIKRLDPDLAVAQIKTLDAVLAESVAQPRFYMVLLTAFAIVAIALSADRHLRRDRVSGRTARA